MRFIKDSCASMLLVEVWGCNHRNWKFSCQQHLSKKQS